MKRKTAICLLLALVLALLAVSVQAEEQLYCVTDEAELLSETEDRQLEELCERISSQFGCGVYIVAVEDYTDYGDGDIYQVTYGIYHEYTMGRGSARNGIMLLLSVDDRTFATFVYGEDAEYAFGDYALQQLEEEFLPCFGEDDWFGGFYAYAAACGEYLAMAAQGKPVEEGKGMLYLIVIGAAFLISLVVVSILKAGMKNVKAGREANAYIARQLNLTQRHDQYTHTTTTRRKVETKSDSGSSSHSGGGGHGRSGSF